MKQWGYKEYKGVSTMLGMEKLYFIVDMSGNYYKLNKKQNLIQAHSSDDADMFSLREANEKIGAGKKAHLFTTVEAWRQEEKDSDEIFVDSSYEGINTPTMFDNLDNDWESYITKLCYMCSHIGEYRCNLNIMLSKVDQEICDIEHFIELNNPSDYEMLKVAKMLQEKRKKRREIKDEINRVELLKSTFVDEEFSIKVHHSLEQMKKMKTRKYTPRVLTELFDLSA